MRIFFLLSALVWAELISAQTPTSIEAVEYDPTGQRWFVSNGSSLLVTDNQGIDWSFFGEAQATHGMEVMGNHLFAIGDNVIRAYDLGDASEVGSLSIPGVGFLNGMGNDGTSLLVVSDFSSSRLYTVDASDPANVVYPARWKLWRNAQWRCGGRRKQPGHRGLLVQRRPHTGGGFGER